VHLEHILGLHLPMHRLRTRPNMVIRSLIKSATSSIAPCPIHDIILTNQAFCEGLWAWLVSLSPARVLA
jgi:hypothetical protein